jgi:hypothetical protein
MSSQNIKLEFGGKMKFTVVGMEKGEELFHRSGVP